MLRGSATPAKKQITKKLNTALKLLKEQGYGAVNIEQPAKEMGCFAQPVYLSFSRMEELRQKLIPLAVAEFESYMKSGSENGAVCLYGMQYISFAREESRLFCFLFMRPNAFSEIKQTLN